MAEPIIATSLQVGYHPTPAGLPHGISFRFREAGGAETVVFLPCVGSGPEDVKEPFGDLMSALNRLFHRTLDG